MDITFLASAPAGAFVLVRRGVEVLEHVASVALHQLCHRERGLVRGVRVAEHAAHQQVGMGSNLRVGVHATGDVVDEDVAVAVETRVIRRPQLVPRLGRFELGVSPLEAGLGVGQRDQVAGLQRRAVLRNVWT
jgi:hypothetical protein